MEPEEGGVAPLSGSRGERPGPGPLNRFGSEQSSSSRAVCILTLQEKLLEIDGVLSALFCQKHSQYSVISSLDSSSVPQH